MRGRLVALALLLAAIRVGADVPTRTEQLIYSLLAFNGREYSPTFARQDAKEVYLLADTDAILSLRKTFVYWWPVTSEWRTDTETLNQLFRGTLEVSAGPRGPVRRFPLERYTYYNVRGDYDQLWHVATGREAERVLADHRASYNAYFSAVEDYSRCVSEVEQRMAQLADRIRTGRERGVDVSDLVAEANALRTPDPPPVPHDYAVPPTDLLEAFILNLPAGTYGARLVLEDGSVLEGSDKRIVVHRRIRSGTIGYEVIPSDKWTRVEESSTPAAVLYVNGAADLYLQPFFQDEFNDYAWQQTTRNGSRGNPVIPKWVRTQQVPHVEVELRGPGRPPGRVREQPFYVEQADTSALGYTIVPYDPAGAHKGKEPSLVAFAVPLRKGDAVIHLRALDASGSVLEGSERQIRVIRRSPVTSLFPFLAALPLLAMISVLVARARKVRS